MSNELAEALQKHTQEKRRNRRIGAAVIYLFMTVVLLGLIFALWPRESSAASLLPPQHVRASQSHLGGFATAYVGPRTLLPKQTIVKRSYTARVTVYMSTPGQTDSDPFHTANGEHVYWGGAAMNCVPFGTKFRLPKVFGDKVFKVNDRGGMPCGDPDIWLPSNDFHGWKGTTNTLVEILK